MGDSGNDDNGGVLLMILEDASDDDVDDEEVPMYVCGVRAVYENPESKSRHQISPESIMACMPRMALARHKLTACNLFFWSQSMRTLGGSACNLFSIWSQCMRSVLECFCLATIFV